MSQRYINRELSWIEFNARVLSEAENPDVPLLERFKFLSIVSSNFDEFFMVRVASVKHAIATGQSGSCPTGLSPREQLNRIRTRVRELTEAKYQLLLDELLPALAAEGVTRLPAGAWDNEQQAHVRAFFRDRVFPVLTPIRVQPEDPLSAVGNLRLHAAFLLEPGPDAQQSDSSAGESPHLAIVPVPESLERIVYLPTGQSGAIAFTFLEQIILSEAYQLFPGYRITEQCLFRVTRDADFGVDEERDEDFVEAMEHVIERRDRSVAVRLNINGGSTLLKQRLVEIFKLEDGDIFESPDPLELRHLMDIATIDGLDRLKEKPWRSMESIWIDEDRPIRETLRKRDVLLSHPYESFDPVVRMVEEAATDPDTLAIKMTLYRTSGNSPIIAALERAAQEGKQVSVLVELKARFDEERNIGWAERLERAGVIVMYGIARLKVHAKALMIVRREDEGVRRYFHLGTGNYNDKTARLYTDLGLLTSDEGLGYELGLFFNSITGYSVIPGLKSLSIAPISLKPRIIELIGREANRAAAGGVGRIMAKMNALADPDIIEALYAASQSGVEIMLNIRGICMLIPGIPGLSENIRVVSIVDRYLEHARVSFFENGGNPEVYLTSADWMPRNLEKRVELMFPIKDAGIRRRIEELVEQFFDDNDKAHELMSDGSWKRVARKRDEPRVRAQQLQYEKIRSRVAVESTEVRQAFDVRRKPPRT